MSDLPDFIDPDLFQQWIEWRKELNGKLSDKSLERIVKLGITKLTRLHSEGYDTSICIENTIINEWKGFFPHDRSQASNRVHGGFVSRADQTRAEIDRLFGAGEDADASGGDGEAGQLRIVK
jgi:hypothetical protein